MVIEPIRCGICWLVIFIGICPQLFVAAELQSGDPAERREAVLKIACTKPANGVDLAAKALKDDNMVVRRAAALCLKNYGKAATPALKQALCNLDEIVRLIALSGLHEVSALDFGTLAAVLKDSSPVVRQRAVEYLIAIAPRTQEVAALLKQAAKDESPVVRNNALKALFPFHRNIVLLRDRVDKAVVVKDTIKLPSGGWKLKPDPALIGHTDKWFDPALNDNDWGKADIEKSWMAFVDPRYTGVAWYRGKFILPNKPVYDAVELFFEAVDESAWVWINGQYAGEHDIGTGGWDQSFQLDVADFLKWGEENRITVRVLRESLINKAGLGGIWKPVTLQILKTQ